MAGTGSDPTDLVRRVQAGDPAAQRELHDGYRARLARFCRTRLDDPGEVEDCVQEVFESTFAAIGTLRDPEALLGWLLAIAGRKAAERNRQRQRHPAAGEIPPEFPDPVSDPELDSRRRELLDSIADALDGLKPTPKSIMKAFIREGGLRGSELAPRFGWDVKTADHELYEARTG